MGQSIVLGEIKAEIPLQNENPLNDQIYGSSTRNESNHMHKKVK